MSKPAEIASKTDTKRSTLSQAIYVSEARSEMDDLQLAQILAQCRKHNEHRDITGVLLFKNGHFLQAIEGPRDTVAELLARISKDSRHSKVEILLEESISERDFPDWTMAFSNIDRLDLSKFEGFAAFDKLQFNAESFQQASVAPRDMLTAFKQELWD